MIGYQSTQGTNVHDLFVDVCKSNILLNHMVDCICFIRSYLFNETHNHDDYVNIK